MVTRFHRIYGRTVVCALLVSLLAACPALAGSGAKISNAARAPLATSIREHMEYLAGDALQGRGSGTAHEEAAARYIAGELKRYGVEPATENGGFVQPIELRARSVTGPPVLKFRGAQGEVAWTHGKQFVTVRLGTAHISGPLQKIDGRDAEQLRGIREGAIVYLSPSGDREGSSPWQQAFDVLQRGAAALLLSNVASASWDMWANSLPRIGESLDDGKSGQLGGEVTELVLSKQAAGEVARLADGTVITLEGPVSARKAQTWDVIGKLTGSDARLGQQAILLSAHLDHLGVGPPVAGRSIYYGADDDASGVSAVLELARALAAGPRPRRTVIFALFGSEENGGLGSTWFREHPPVPLHDIVANLEFEMLGRPDKAIPAGSLWLTGYERSDLGPQLDEHGGCLVADPRPQEHFFQRSDNYVLAKKGVVAQTVSSYGMHKDYHRPTDDLAHIDFDHLDTAIESLIAPVTWLANSEFVPQWKPGKSPNQSALPER